MRSWARHVDRCDNCGTVDVPHRARGLCARCYERARSVVNRTNRPDHRRRGLRGELALLLSATPLRREYVELGRSIPEIATHFGCSPQYVYDLMRRWGISARSQRDARRLAVERGKIPGHHRVHVNEEFFETWCPEMAYVLGIVATDGCVQGAELDPRTGRRKAGLLVFTQKDRELVDKVLTLMNCDARIRFREGRQFATTTAGAVYTVSIASATLLESLSKHGIGPRKSRTLAFPQVPIELVRHFLRGCWDGDGSIFRGRGLLIASFVSGSRSFIDGLVAALTNAGFSRRTVYVEQRKNPSYKISFQGAEAVRLCAYLYEGVAAGERLSRKFQVYESFISESASAAAK